MPELSGYAREVITAQDFDYFESEAEARKYVVAAGLDPSDISHTELGYTKVPREYSPYIDLNIDDACVLLGSSGPRDFAHLDRYNLTLGRSNDGSDASLSVSPQARTAFLHIQGGSVIRHGLQPKRSAKEPVLEQDPNQFIKLPLGRHILVPDSPDGDFDLAILDSFRDWERVLIVGEVAIKRFLHRSFYQESPLIGDVQRAARIGQAGLLLGLEAEAGLGTNFRSILAKHGPVTAD
jgi:hypothetical protein